MTAGTRAAERMVFAPRPPAQLARERGLKRQISSLFHSISEDGRRCQPNWCGRCLTQRAEVTDELQLIRLIASPSSEATESVP